MVNPTFAELMALNKTADGVYESVLNPYPMVAQFGGKVGYGGQGMMVACAAAHEGVPDDFRLYSMVGNIIGPSFVDRKLYARVQQVRRSRSFITKTVNIFQKTDDGAERACQVMVVDFHQIDRNEVLRYGRPPEADPGSPEKGLTRSQKDEQGVLQGSITPKQRDMLAKMYDLLESLTESRTTQSGGMFTTTYEGLAPKLGGQTDKQVWERHSSVFQRAREKLDGHVANFAVATYLLDGGLTVAPMIHSNKHLFSANVATLDFALRFFTPDIDFNQWHVRQMKTHNAGAGRSLNELSLFDAKGNMLATMTEACLLRANKPTAKM